MYCWCAAIRSLSASAMAGIWPFFAKNFNMPWFCWVSGMISTGAGSTLADQKSTKAHQHYRIGFFQGIRDAVQRRIKRSGGNRKRGLPYVFLQRCGSHVL